MYGKRLAKQWAAFFAGGSRAGNCLIIIKGQLIFIKRLLITTAGFVVIKRVINHYKSALINISRSKSRINH
jgi:hypothetical protein